MSLRLWLLNLFLRRIERPALSKLQGPAEIRQRLERQARLIFRPKRGAVVGKGMFDSQVSALQIGDGNNGYLLYFHGGAYVFGSARTHARMVGRMSKLTGITSFSVNYRLAPEHPFPAAIDDAVTAYKTLLHDVDPASIVIGGDSAGGGLALALLGYICKNDLPRPAGLFALSPWTDLTMTSTSMSENAKAEVMLPPERIAEARDFYLAGEDPKNSLASPLYAEFDNAPPVYISVGDTEILFDDAKSMAHRLKEFGVKTTLEITANTPHVLPFFHGFAPEADRAMDQVTGFIKRVLAGP